MKSKFGVEIELISKLNNQDLMAMVMALGGVERLNTGLARHDVNKWTIKGDCSIRSTEAYPYTYEITTPPMHVHEMGEIKAVLRALKGHVSVNRSCGLHVHIEMPSFDSVLASMHIWRRYEDTIIEFFPLSRRENTYCKRLKGHRITRNWRDRYYMLNPTSWWVRKTMEIRAHQGTVNYNKIKRWILFCDALAQKGIQMQNDIPNLSAILRRRVNLPSLWDFINFNGKTERFYTARTIHFKKRLAPQETILDAEILEREVA